MYLFFDTETADLPKRWDAPATDTSNWPHLVQVAWIVCDAHGAPQLAESHLIQPVGFSISPGAMARHGITTAHARAHGVPLEPALKKFMTALADAAIVVAHNVDFDVKVLSAEFFRAGLADPFIGKTLRCTMKESTAFCKLPGGRGYKWPTLLELHQTLFGESFGGAHDAASDCQACLRCYFALKSRGVLA